MSIEQGVLAATLAVLSMLATFVLRSSLLREDFFPSQRARVLSRMRWGSAGLFALAVLALVGQAVVGHQRLGTIAQQEQKLLEIQGELVRLRVDYELVRKELHAAAAAPALVDARRALAKAPAEPEQSAQTEEVAEVLVDRAVMRDGPAGKARFTLTSGTRLHLQGKPADYSGRAWREAQTEDGRSGWIAEELLSAVKS